MAASSWTRKWICGAHLLLPSSNGLSEKNDMDVKKWTLDWRNNIYSSGTVLLTITAFLSVKVLLQTALLVILLTLSTTLLCQLMNAEMLVQVVPMRRERVAM